MNLEKAQKVLFPADLAIFRIAQAQESANAK